LEGEERGVANEERPSTVQTKVAGREGPSAKKRPNGPGKSSERVPQINDASVANLTSKSKTITETKKYRLRLGGKCKNVCRKNLTNYSRSAARGERSGPDRRV